MNVLFYPDFSYFYNESVNLDNEQEALKARWKEKSAAQDETMAALDKKGADSKKTVKMQTPKESWKEYGIDSIFVIQ